MNANSSEFVNYDVLQPTESIESLDGVIHGTAEPTETLDNVIMNANSEHVETLDNVINDAESIESLDAESLLTSKDILEISPKRIKMN